MTEGTGYISVTAKTEGFRRAGRAWSTMAVVVAAALFTDEQLAALRADPELVVVDAPAPDESAAEAADVEAFGKPGERAPEAVAPESAADRIGRIVAAIGELEEGNPKHWTAGGKPEVAALRKLTDVEVTAEARDDAWEAYQASQAGDVAAE